jgi:ATP-dependent Zn protease
MVTPGADPGRKVSIIRRAPALGVTFQAAADRYGYSARYLRGRIVGALGGRAAEEIVYEDVTTGAESDLGQVTGIAVAGIPATRRWLVATCPAPHAHPRPPAETADATAKI